MKKSFAAALALLITISMASCGNFGRPDPKTVERTNEDQNSSRRSLVDEMFSTDEESSVSDNAEYSIEDDPEELQKSYVCDNCGCTFTMEEAIDDYGDRFNGDLSYISCRHAGDLCGNCAADKTEAEMIYD